MLPFRVIQIEQHRALQQSASRPFFPNSSEPVSQLRFSSGHDFSRAVTDPNSEWLQPLRDRICNLNAGRSLLTELPFDRNFAASNRQIPDLLPGPDFESISSRNTVCLMQKNEGALAQWAPTSNRKWTKNRCYRKQTTKPCLTEARTHIKVSLNSTRIAQKSGAGNYISNRFWDKNRCYRKQTTRPCLTGSRIAIRLSPKLHKARRENERQFHRKSRTAPAL